MTLSSVVFTLSAMNIPDPNATTLTSPELWLKTHGDALYRFALLRVRNTTVAEDMVQETLLAALKSKQQYAGRASEATWLIAIMKNKIMDYFRKQSREAPAAEEDVANLEEDLDPYFATNGHWKALPTAANHPESALEQSEFWHIFLSCIEAIPAKQAQVFQLTEMDGLSGAEISKVLNMSTSNVWVALHRARLRLRDCLNQHWFGLDRGD